MNIFNVFTYTCMLLLQCIPVCSEGAELVEIHVLVAMHNTEEALGAK